MFRGELKIRKYLISISIKTWEHSEYLLRKTLLVKLVIINQQNH